ncbi:MAG: hypothetical protein JO222_10800, partial [Frankiales bacterium]|nr:hypothetical protein [Frankiales bacterium]
MTRLPYRPLLIGLPLALVAGALAGVAGAADGSHRSAGTVSITTVSNRADLVSAGDALIRLSAPRGA